MGQIIMRNCDLRDIRVRVNIPSPIWQVQVQIWCVISLIWGHLNPIRQVVPLISHLCAYSPHRSHLYPPSLSFASTTLPSSQNTKLSHPSLSLYAMMQSRHWVQHTPSTAYTKYSIHRVQHTPSTAYTEYNIHWVQHTPSTAYTKYSIHQVQHTPSTAYTKYSIHWVQHMQDCFSFLHSHDYELTPECSFSFQCASLYNRLPSASSPWESKGKVTLSHSHVCQSTNWWIES